MALEITVDGTTIKNPPKPPLFSKYPVTKAGRVASALMTIDFLAEKRTIQFEYQAMDASDLETIKSTIFNFPTMFHTLVIRDNASELTFTVYPGALNYRPYRTDNNGYWIYTDVTFQLIEQ